jgi:hypothetical protein
MITLQPINEFKKLDGKVYWGRHIINGADFDSFEPLNAIWARDNRRIYTYDSPLRGADRDTFCVLNKIFAKDKNKVYFLSGSIQDANPATFRALDAGWFVGAWNLESCQGYAADDVHVFHYVLTIGKPRLVRGADLPSFRVLQYGFAADKAQVYHEGVRLPKANPAKFRPLGHYYSTDDTRVYYGNTMLVGADPSTFHVSPNDQVYGFDKNHKYDRHRVVT